MNRRSFLKGLIGVAIAAASPIPQLGTKVIETLTIAKRELIISKILKTEEGRAALAQSMVEPIKRSLKYGALGKKLVMIDKFYE